MIRLSIFGTASGILSFCLGFHVVFLTLVSFTSSLAYSDILAVICPHDRFSKDLKLPVIIYKFANNQRSLNKFFPYGKKFKGGIRCALADINGDGTSDIITVPGPGADAEVRVFDGLTRTQLSGTVGEFLAFDPGNKKGAYVASADVDGDGVNDIVVGSGGEPRINIFNGTNGEQISSFLAFDSTFTGGVRIAAKDINGGGKAEVVTAQGPGGTPEIRIFDKDGQLLNSLSAFDDTTLTTGVNVAVGDVDNDGRPDIFTCPASLGGTTSNIRTLNELSSEEIMLIPGYSAFYRNGVFLGVGDDTEGASIGFLPLIVGGYGREGGQVKVINPNTSELIDSFRPYPKKYLKGVFVSGG